MSTPNAALQAKFGGLRDALSQSLIERDAEVECLLLGLVAQEHVLLVGPPGTGKSLACNGLTSAIDGAVLFETLLSKFSTPEELFGPVSVQALKVDKYERQLAGYLATAHVGFLDEIWKASSAILNATLTLMNERKYDNGGKRVNCPLRILVSASNEWPVGEGFAELGAAFDRFLIRRAVKPVSSANREQLMFADLPDVGKHVTLMDVDGACIAAKSLPFTPEGKAAYLQIVENLHAEGITPGDRRLRKGVTVAKAAAWLDGASEVRVPHLECLQHVLWDDPAEQPQKASEIVCRVANPVGAEINATLAEADEILSKVDIAKLTVADPDTVASVKKLRECVGKLDRLSKDGNGRAVKAKEYVNGKLVEMNKKMLGI